MAVGSIKGAAVAKVGVALETNNIVPLGPWVKIGRFWQAGWAGSMMVGVVVVIFAGAGAMGVYFDLLVIVKVLLL